MSRDAARIAVVGYVEARKALWANPGLAIELPNMPAIDPATQTEPFLKVKIVYVSGEQAGLGPSGKTRAYGNVVFEAWQKLGTGTKEANELLDHFAPGLSRSDIYAPIRTSALIPVPNFEKTGWDVTPVVVPFWYDSSY